MVGCITTSKGACFIHCETSQPTPDAAVHGLRQVHTGEAHAMSRLAPPSPFQEWPTAREGMPHSEEGQQQDAHEHTNNKKTCYISQLKVSNNEIGLGNFYRTDFCKVNMDSFWQQMKATLTWKHSEVAFSSSSMREHSEGNKESPNMMAPTWRENKQFWVSYFLIHDQKHIVLDSSEYFKKGLTSAGFEIKNTEHRWGYS